MLKSVEAYGLSFLVPERDRVVGRSLAVHGEFARIESDFIIENLRTATPATIIDVGANLGAIALPVAAALPAWKVIAIEAQRAVAGILAANALNNALYNVDVLNAVASEETGLTSFPQASLTSDLNFGAVSARDAHRPESIRACTLDEVATDNVRLIKIDVEGFEPQVLKGARRLIGEVRPIWMLEAGVSTLDAAHAAMRLLMDAGYDLFWLYSPFVTRTAKRGPPAPMFGDMNFCALPAGVANLWNLPPIGDPTDRFAQRDELPYLSRYGF